MRRKDKPRVIVVFQTDGDENASTEHSIDELRDLIARRKTDDWVFVFLGANIDAYSIASSLGITEEATLSYSGERSVGVLQEVAAFAADFARGVGEVRFTAAQKRAAGDPDAGFENPGPGGSL